MLHREQPIYLDTETNGLVWPSVAKVVVAKDTRVPESPVYFSAMLDCSEQVSKLEDFIRGRVVIGWNVGFDMSMLHAAGVDISVASLWIDGCELNRLRHSDWLSHRLKDLARKYMLSTDDEDAVRDDVKTFLEGSLSKANVAMNMWRSSKVWEYCKQDVERTELLVKHLRLLDTQNEEFFKVDSQVLVWTAKRYVAGVLLDPNIVEKVHDMYVDRINGIIDRANELGVPVNSPKALFEFFYLKDPTVSLVSTNEEALSELKLNEKLSEFAELTLKYRSAKTRIGLMNKLHEATKRPDCRIHPMFGITTVTGRLACRSPNMQQWPRAVKGELGIRDCMIADHGYKIVKFDYSQQELRICCALIGSQRLLEMIHSKDPHAYLANYLMDRSDSLISLQDVAKQLSHAITPEDIAEVYDREQDVVAAEKALFDTKLIRTTIKTIVFMQLYGSGLKKVAQDLKQPYSKVAPKYYGFQKLFASFQPRPDIKCYYGTNLTCDSPHKALNRYGQGTGAEISKRTVCAILDKGIDLLATVHDDFKAQVPINSNATSKDLFKPIVDQFCINGVSMEGDYE